MDDPKLEHARQKLESAVSLDPQEADAETVHKKPMTKSHEAQQTPFSGQERTSQGDSGKSSLTELSRSSMSMFVNTLVHQRQQPSIPLAKTAQRSIDRNDKDFEHHLDELKGKNFDILWRQDWFVVDRFKWMINSPHLFADKHRFEELSKSRHATHAL